jgi:hypothetical protein
LKLAAKKIKDAKDIEFNLAKALNVTQDKLANQTAIDKEVNVSLAESR